MEYINSLNEEQKKFVLHPVGHPALLLAGAGSGKTTACKSRVEHLIREGETPKKILVITFTNKAASEISERVQKALNLPSEALPCMSTMHSLALRFIRRNPAGFGLGPKITPLDDWDQLQLFKSILERKKSEVDPYKLKDKIDYHRARGISFRKDYTSEVHKAALAAHAGYHVMVEEESYLWELFQVEKQKANLLDFSDMISLCNERFIKDPEWGFKVHKLFNHILVDEAQDSGVPMLTFINNLVGLDNRNLVIIGDLNQSIYQFNGANPGLIIDYSKNWRGLVPTLYRLQRNHRSGSKIVDLANKLCTKMTDTLPLEMVSHRGEIEGFRGEIRVVEEDTSYDVAAAIASKLSCGDMKYKDVAILVRTSNQIREIEGALVSNRIPYVVRGGRGLLQTEEIKDIISYIKLASNPNDFPSLSRASAVPKRGIGDSTLERIRLRAETSYNGNLVEACIPFGGKIEGFANIINSIREVASSPVKVLSRTLASVMYEDYLKKKYGKEQGKLKTKLENIGRLKDLIEGMANEQDMSLDDIVFQLTMEKAPEDDEKGAVVISTIHSAKGLEWPCVFVWSFCEGSIPHWRCVGTPEECSEERRLGYVAITRARDTLYLCVPERMPFGQGLRYADPSRFLDEIGIQVR